ncbi:MAG: TerB family tellurite resistance protein [Deltaproteobacteria bacterium]|nr:TerB family tellurite resistance protein [Deltaproteobacteria bacterium]
MLGVMKKFFQQDAVPDKTEIKEEDRAERIQVATCALLLEVANSDDEFSDIERDNIVQILERDFELSDEYAKELMELSDKEREESIDLWQFTNLVNEHYSIEEKIKIIEMVWKVIYADGKLDKYEDHLAHKLSNLLKLTHKQLIDAKLKMRDG